MKKNVLLLGLLFVLGFSTNAQFNKNNFSLNSGVNILLTPKGVGIDNCGVVFSNEYSRFFTKNFSASINMEYIHSQKFYNDKFTTPNDPVDFSQYESTLVTGDFRNMEFPEGMINYNQNRANTHNHFIGGLHVNYAILNDKFSLWQLSLGGKMGYFNKTYVVLSGAADLTRPTMINYIYYSRLVDAGITANMQYHFKINSNNLIGFITSYNHFFKSKYKYFNICLSYKISF